MVLDFTKSSSDLFKEYLSKLLLETGLGELKPVSFFYINYPPKYSSCASLIYICLKSSIIKMESSLHDIIQQCCRHERAGQKLLFDQYQGVLYPICLRYVKIEQEAQDIFIEGFYKILSRIQDYKGDGSFEGWMKKIMVNEALMYLRKRKRLLLMVEWKDQDIAEPKESWDEFEYEEILELIHQLPDGYRTIFNLYILEGYKHREIAEELNISINTSKSQLILAKKRLLELYKKKEILNYKKG